MKRRICLAAACLVFLCVAFALRTRAVVLPANCPVSLTNPDGQALNLEKYDLRVAVHGPLSLVEMEMTFRNPANRQMEGRFQYLLPPGATISRFAKEVNGKLMEGEVVERLRAQAIYTQILHTMRDPALLEMDQGNRFSARVFPIPANGTVRLLLAYSQVLAGKDGQRKLVVPLAGMPKIGSFSLATVIPADAQVTGLPDAVQGTVADFTPPRDLEILFKTDQKAACDAVKAGNFQMLAFRPEIPQATAEPAREWVFYFDTSASNADTEAQRLAAIETLLVETVPVLRQKDNLFTAWAFDLNVAPVMPAVSMNSKGGKPIMPEVVRLLRARHALGATNLEAAMKHIGEQARAAQKPTRFVLVSDGIATLGVREARDIVAALGDWPAQHVLHALVIGGKQDDKMLAAIVEKTRGRVVTLPFGEKADVNIAKTLAELQAPLGMGFEFYDEGAAWIYPKTFRDVRPGSELIVFSELKDGAPPKPGVIQRGADGKVAKDAPLAAAPTEVPGFAPLLQREAYHAFLDHLEKLEQAEKNDAKRAELHKQRIEVSVKSRVLCPLTSLLVLETEDDYRRFGIERTALADIMVVGGKGIELKKRGAEDMPPPRPKPPVAQAKAVEKRKLEAGEAEAADKPAGPGRTGGRPAAVEELLKELKDAKGDDDTGVYRLQDAGGQGGGGRGEGRALEALSAGIRQRFVMGRESEPAAATGAPRAEAPAPSTPRGGAAAAPATPAPASPPAEAGREREQQAAGRGPAAAPAKPAPPDWAAQYGAAIKEEQLGELRAKVQAAPRDRTLRNAYADMLKKSQQWDSLQGEAFAWLPFDPENPQVYEFLGNSATGLKDNETALRAFTSIAEIAPNRAALLARAGWLLLTAKKCEMAEQMFREALKNRQDDCNIYRGLALSLWLNGNHDGAAKALEEALGKNFDPRYGDVKRVLREELGYVLRAWQKKDAAQSDAINQRANKAGVRLDLYDALRATLCWETDANDVDLHVVDPNGEECFYSHKNNASGLELYSDQTQGLGPEVIRTAKAIPGTYHVGVNYFSAGPMGVSRGVVVVMQPKDGVADEPQIVPFCLVPGGPDMRHLAAAKF